MPDGDDLGSGSSPGGPSKAVMRTVSSIGDIDQASWDAAAGTDNPFISHAFLSVLEDSGSCTAETGWQPQHIAVETDRGEPLGFAPCYLKAHSYGEYVFDHGWANAFERAGGQYYPKLQVAVPFSPVTGPRLLVHPSAAPDLARQTLISALKKTTEHYNVSSLHVTFAQEHDCDALSQAGFLVRYGEQFHWKNEGYETFDDFLERLTSRKRKMIRRERRGAQESGVTVRTLTGDEITAEHWDRFYQFYLDTVDRKWAHAYLTREFFYLLGERLGKKVILMVGERNGQMIAGALNLCGSKTLFGRTWGAGEDVPFLHFELCYYRAIDYAIRRGLDWVEAGAQGPHKIQRGYLPRRTYSAHWIRNPAFREAVEQYLDHERRAIDREMADLGEWSPFKAGGTGDWD